MSNYHISKNKQSNKWNIQKEGGTRASCTVSTQQQAERLAKRFAHNTGGGEMRIHNVKGKIRDSDTVRPGKEGRKKDHRH